MNPREQAAVEAAVRAVEAAEASRGQFRGTRPDELLDERLGPFDWSTFDCRGYRLLREVGRRANRRAELEGGSPIPPEQRGRKFEDATLRARERLSGAVRA